MITIATVAVTALIARAIFHLAWAVRNSAFLLRCKPTDEPLSADRQIIILVSVYNEAETVANTIYYLDHQIHSMHNVSAIIVGTARERDSRGVNQTLEAARAASAQTSCISFSECPANADSKARQINFVLSSLPNDPKIWIVIQDIDTRFGEDGLSSFVHLVNRDVPVIQRHSTFFLNWSALSIIQRAQAFYNSRWAVTHEISRTLMANHWPFCAHVVGHGLCMNLAILRRFGGLPTETLTEDTHLGFYLRSCRVSVISTCDLQDSDCPTTISDGFRQQLSWSYGPMNYPRYLAYFRSHFPEEYAQRPVWTRLVALVGVITYIAWQFSAYIMVFMAFLLFTDLAAIAAIWWFIYLVENLVCAGLFWRMGRISMLDAIFSPVYVLLHALPHTLSANIGLLRYVTSGHARRYKTTHA